MKLPAPKCRRCKGCVPEEDTVSFWMPRPTGPEQLVLMCRPCSASWSELATSKAYSDAWMRKRKAAA